MRRNLTAIPAVLALAAVLLVGPAPAAGHILRLADGAYASFAELIEDLRGVRLVFIGELHDSEAHHRAQLQVIQGLERAGAKVAIGLEMFRSDSQAALDRWVAGTISLEDFLRVYEDNWGMWPQYREIFLYARQEKIPLIGLNLSREITQQVARNGFASLSEEQLEKLPKVRCVLDPAYEKFIRRALGRHANHDSTFRNFCEAQLLWDKIMARNALRYLRDHPDTMMVVLAGSGHSWKYGIPAQLTREAKISFRVLLPEIPGRLEAGEVTPEDADYLMLGLEEGPLH